MSADVNECADINECAYQTSNRCDENADCSNTEGSYTCSCQAGYQGDGFVCGGMIKITAKI